MRRLGYIAFTVLCGVLGQSGVAQTADPVARLKEFSEFRQVDVKRLLDGEILSERGALMNLRTGIATQACYAVPASPEETARRLQQWNPLAHESLNVYRFHSVRLPPDAADFNDLDFKLDKRAVRWLLSKTLTTTAGDSDLNLSRSESRQIASSLKKTSTPQEVAACWTKLLMARASSFQTRGFDGMAPYEVSGETVSPAEQIRLMLKEKSRIAREFDPVIQKAGLTPGSAPTLKPFYYWNLFSSEGYGTLCLGATYSLPVGDRYQLLDVEYYVSGSYYASATLYEIWPIQAGNKKGSLVWRGDLFSAGGLAYTKGVERIAYGAIMLLEIKKGIRAFQDDIKGAR
ncbi:MAG: hypothetical protein HZC54_10955 [Verrucomicrobia bacterium]|nr:hypothetical protein [Verrucomicrobiota bacterium]